MYEFKDKKDRSLALRPEGTASVARCFIENKLYTDLPRKFWYFEPMYRYDRPQKGRYREHFQFGCEAYGSNDARVDAEIISIPYHLFETLGLEGVKVRINTLGDNESRENYKKALVDYLKPHIDSLCEDCKERFNKNPLRILDCKVDKDNEILKNIPKTIDYLNEESKTFFDEVLSYLDSLEICYEVDPKTIRGLDYYTHTVFEIEADIKDFGAQNVLCAGGRYNNLVENLDGPATPAVGFGLGSERLLLALEHENIDIVDEKSVDVYVIPMTSDKSFSFSLVYLLRTLGLSVETDYLNRKLANNFKYAEKINAKYTVVIGEDEIEKEYFTVKNMKTREEEKVDFNLSTKDVYNKIRGLYPWPIGYTSLDGKKVKLHLSRVGTSKKEGSIGEIINIYNDALGVKTLDGEILLTMIQFEGKKKILVKDYLNGVHDKESLLGKKFI